MTNVNYLEGLIRDGEENPNLTVLAPQSTTNLLKSQFLSSPLFPTVANAYNLK